MDAPTHTMDFGSLTIAYDDRVLEPRPWTALQSRWAQELLAEAAPGPVLELCTGAGHIGLLAVTGSSRELVAVDADAHACATARHNADSNGLGDRVEVRCGDMEEVIGAGDRFALVVADPPWVPSSELTRFPSDPVLAIDGGDDGLSVARACLRVAGRVLDRGGSLLLQLGDDGQADLLAHPGLVEVGRRQGERGIVVRLVRG